MSTRLKRNMSMLLAGALVVTTILGGLPIQQTRAAPALSEPFIKKFDLGAAPATGNNSGGPTMEGFIGVTHSTLYTPELGYGLDIELASRYRADPLADDMSNDFVLGGVGAPFTFMADVPNGNYKVTLYAGDLLQTTSTYKNNISIENVVKEGMSARREVISKEYEATVTDGQLNVQVTGNGTYSILNGVIIEMVLPSVPQGLALTSVTASEASLSWESAPNAVSYNIYRSTGMEGEIVSIAEQVSGVSYTDNGVAAGSSYIYYVSSVNAFGQQSALSAASEAAIIPAPQAPAVPSGLLVSKVTASSVTLSWSVAEGASSYDVYRSNAEGEFVKIGMESVTSFTDNEADTSAVQSYKIKAVNGAGESEFSELAASSVYVPPVVLPDGEVKRFDFGNGELEDGYVGISEAIPYSADIKYGFADTTKVSFEDRQTDDALRSDFALIQDTEFIVDLPNADYTVTLIAGDASDVTDIGIRAESMDKVMRLDNNAVRPAGQYLEMSFDIALVDGQLNLLFTGSAPKINSLVITKQQDRLAGELPTVYMAGDSTVQTYDPYWLPQAGWGQMIPRFFSNDVIFKNHAIGGRSSKNYISQGRLDEVLRAIKPGDYFLVQFGHNDATISVPDRYAAPADYKNYLKTYVNGARQRGATPILVTPMGRRSFNAETGKFNVSFPEYVQAMKEVAQELEVDLVDLSTLSISYYDSIGEAATKSVFLHTPPGVYAAFPNGSADDTHFQEYGAIQLARLLSGGIKELELPLSALVEEIVPPAEVPVNPTGLVAGSISNAGAFLIWDETPTADIYKVYRKLASAPDSEYAMVGTSTIPTLSLGGMQEGQSYQVRITAVNGKGESAPSEPVLIVTKFAKYRYDFGPVGAPVADGYTEVTRATIYTPETGYGITDSTGMIDRDRGDAADNLRRDFVAYFGNSYEFKVDLPNGYYSVKTYTGDWIGSTRTVVAIEGKDYGTISSGKQNIAERVFNMIAVKDGQLNMVLSGQTAHLNGVEITPILLAPTSLVLDGLDVSGDPITAKLTWTGVEGAAKYNVYRKATVEVSAVLLGQTTAASYTDTTADVGLEYEYYVTAVDTTDFESVASNTLEVSMIDPNVEIAGVPTGLTLQAISKNAISLTWNELDAARMYNVYRSKKADGQFVLIGKSNTASYTDNTVLTTIPYYYKVASVNAGGISEMSAALATEAVTTLVRQMEYIDRSPAAIKTDTGNYIGWRMLGLDPEAIGFNVYRDGAKLNASPITTSTNFVDTAGTDTSVYHITSALNGAEQKVTSDFGVWQQQYKSVSLQKPADGYTKDGQPYTYAAGDASVGDLDGDGQYEIVMLWSPSNSKDNSHAGYTGIVYMDAYKLDGTRLWRINLGPNIRAGAHYTQFMVYDLDSDGRAEVSFKTADGTIDGTGKVIGDPSKDHRSSAGYVLIGNEYLTVFEGSTGKALSTVDYDPPRGNVADWGDGYGNRVDRFLAAVAYLDGEMPSLMFSRGYYTRTVLAAYDFRDGELTKRWVFDSNKEGFESYSGQGNHNLSVGDVDGDGKDEIIFGAMAIDDDGLPLHNTGLGHGDAMHLGDLDPERPGLEIFGVHERTDSPYGLEMRDANTGEIIWGINTGLDTGRGMSADIDPRHPGEEMWTANIENAQHIPVSGLFTAKGKLITTNIPTSTNFGVWWDGDLLRELQDYNRIDKWDYMNETTVNLLTAEGASSNNSTKANPSLQADLFGDWREEIMWRSDDSSEFRIYSTVDVTDYRIRTLMHDPIYRLGIAWQNVSYNQPPHPSFYLGHGMTTPPQPSISYENEFMQSIKVTAAENASSVVAGNTLQMAAAVIADTAASKSVTWSVTNEDGGTTTSASISMNGLLQGVSPGTVKVVATAADGSGVMGEKLITILKKAPGGKPPVHDRSIIIEAQTVNGKASAAVDAEVLKNAIDAASGKTVAVSVKADSSAEEVKVFMPAEAFEEMTKKDKFELTIETGIASITLSKQALAGLLEDGPKSIQLNISHVDKATLSEKERQQVGDSNVYDFNLFVNNEKVNHFEGGNNAVEVAVPYTPGPDEKPGKAVIYYMSDDGQLEAERNAKYDKKTGTVSFKTNRL